ncbi:MAG: cytochrome c maturation protein CcmE [Candidatus Hydrogenedentota bacterium]|nr:MAG: cytochrome c maturation protein CcmE [Candidatus Hydrogenedentota bacterium]
MLFFFLIQFSCFRGSYFTKISLVRLSLFKIRNRMNKKIAIAVVFLVIGFAFLMMQSSSVASHPHLQLSELMTKLKQGENFDGVFMTLYGQVKEGSIQKKGLKAEFILEQKSEQSHYQLPVFFTGKTLLPDTFTDGAMASVEGKLNPKENKFYADKVMAKCASRYEPNKTKK